MDLFIHSLDLEVNNSEENLNLNVTPAGHPLHSKLYKKEAAQICAATLTSSPSADHSDPSIEQLVTKFHAKDLFGNLSKNESYIVCTEISDKMLEIGNGNTNSKLYKKEAAQICAALNLKQKTFREYVRIGRFILSKHNQPEYDKLMDMNMSQIKKTMTPQPTAISNPPAAPKPKHSLKDLEQNIAKLTDLNKKLQDKIVALSDISQERDDLQETLNYLEQWVNDRFEDRNAFRRLLQNR